jgi:putative flippase GtrA
MAQVASLSARLRSSWRTLLKEVSGFGVVGVACFAMDLGIFQALYAHVGLGAVTSKLISTAISMTAGYFGHRHWSFSHRARTGLKREAALFFVVNGVTMAVGLGLVALVRYPLGFDSALALQAANVASTAIGTLLRFAFYRKFVFVAQEAPAALAYRERIERSAPLREAA